MVIVIFVGFQDLAGILAPQWEEVEKAYINSSKEVFHNVREEREKIIRYFYQIRYNLINFGSPEFIL